MKISDKLLKVYRDYYGDDSLGKKRAIAASQSVNHILTMAPKHVTSLLDLGAGEGAVLQELHNIGFADSLHALEISNSGITEIERRSIQSLCSTNQFDGYNIAAEDDQYDLGIAIHVLEHVEHERAFLNEMTRVCRIAYVEVPLELTLNVKKSIKESGPHGHINFYSPSIFRNLIETCGLEVLGFRVFSNSLAYERHVSGRLLGTIKFAIRRGLLSIFPGIAPYFMTYLAGTVCQKKQTVQTALATED